MSADPRLPHDEGQDDDPRLPWPQELFRRMSDLEDVIPRIKARQAATEREVRIVRWLIGIGLPLMAALFAFISQGSP